MNNKTLFNLTFIFLLIIALLLGKKYWIKFQQNRPNDYLKALKKINLDDTVKISIGKGEQVLEITKNLEGWFVASKSADIEKIDDLLNSLKPEENPVLLAESSSQMEKLNLTNDKAIIVSIETAENQKIEFLIGDKIAANTAIAIVGQSKAYSLRNFYSVTSNPSDWYNLTIVDINSTNIKSYSYQNNLGLSYTLNQSENGVWQFASNSENTNNTAINSTLMSINPFKANSLANEDSLLDYNLNYPNFFITIVQKDNTESYLEFYQGTDNYLVKTQPKEDYYIVSAAKAENLDKTKEEFITVQAAE